MLFEALVAVGFFALAAPFGYLSRTVKRREMSPYTKWPLFLGIVHTPVVPLIVFVKLFEVSIEFELALVGLVLLGHLTGVLAHRFRAAQAAAPSAGHAAGDR